MCSTQHPRGHTLTKIKCARCAPTQHERLVSTTAFATCRGRLGIHHDDKTTSKAILYLLGLDVYLRTRLVSATRPATQQGSATGSDTDVFFSICCFSRSPC